MDENDVKVFDKIRGILSTGDVLVDVGANFGIYTDFFLKNTGGTAKVYAVELHHSNFKILADKFGNNENVILKHNAVSDKNEVIDWYENGTHTHNIIGHDCDFKKNRLGGQIQSVTLDELLKNEDHIKFIKIDVEGAENLVLKGMKETVKKIDYMFVECHLNEDWEEVKNYLLNEYNLDCTNIATGEKITQESSRPYLCFCQTKKEE